MNQPKSTTPQQYDTSSAAQQPGYIKNYGNTQNIAPELFTGRVQNKIQSVYTNKQTELSQKAQDAYNKYKSLGGVVSDSSNPNYGAQIQAYNDWQNAMKEANNYSSSAQGQQDQQQQQQQMQQAASKEGSELAQTLGNLGNTYPGDALSAGNIGMAGNIAQDEIAMIQDQGKRQDELNRQRIINSLWQTNISDLGYQKSDLNQMTTQQLMDVAGAQGLELSKSVKDRLSSAGKIQIENEKLAQQRELADNEMTRRQLERQLGRSLQEREDFNTQQDTKLRRMLGMFGGGQVQDMAGNMAVMDAQEKGKQALADLRADYADRMDSLGRQYTAISQTHTNNVKLIESDINNKIEGAFADLTSKIDGYFESGVTNANDIGKAILAAKKDYLKTYMDETAKGAERIQKQNEQTFNQLMKLKEDQRAEDKSMSDLYGVQYRNGEPVLDQNGNRVPTFEMMKFNNEQDKWLSEQKGIFYQNGRPMLDSRGQPIETMTAQKNANEQMWKQREYDLNVAKYNQEESHFQANYANTIADNARQDKKTEFEFVKGQVDAGLLPASALQAFTPAAVISSSYQFTPKGGVAYGTKGLANFVTNLGDRISQAANFAKNNVIPAECVGFVRKVLPDLPTGLYTLADKIQKIGAVYTPVKMPQPGDVLVQDTGQPAGHVAVVSAVDPNTGKFSVSEYNYKAGQYGTRLMNINDKSVSGFFRSPNMQSVQNKPKQGKILPTSTVTMLSDAQQFPQMLNDLETTIKSGGASFGPVMGNIRNYNPFDTTQQVANAQLRTAAQLIGKFMEGGVLRKEDEIKYQQMLPQASDTQDVALGKLNIVRNMLQNKVNQYRGDLTTSGYSVPGSNVTPNMSTPGMVQMKSQSGEVIDVPSDQIQEALSMGLNY